MIREKLRLALLISGGGTTAQEIIRACNDGRLPRVEPACLIASTEQASGIKRAMEAGMNTENILVLTPYDFDDPSALAAKMTRFCREHSVDLFGQYGWLPKTPAEFVNAFPGINQHPGPLSPGRPDFGGKGMFGRRVHCARLYFLRRAKRPPEDMWTEVVAQRVAVEYDQGAVLHRRCVLIEPTDDPTSLQQRALPQEHLVQIETLEDFAENKICVLIRDYLLVRDHELMILDEAKHVARILFPQG